MVFRSSHCHANSIFATVEIDSVTRGLAAWLHFRHRRSLILILIVASSACACLFAGLSESLHFSMPVSDALALQFSLPTTLLAEALISFSSTSTVFLSSFDSTSPVGMFARLI